MLKTVKPYLGSLVVVKGTLGISRGLNWKAKGGTCENVLGHCLQAKIDVMDDSMPVEE